LLRKIALRAYAALAHAWSKSSELWEHSMLLALLVCYRIHTSIPNVEIGSDVTMHESLLRPHDVVAIPPLPTIGESSAKLKQQEIRQEEKRQSQIAQSRARNAGKEPAGKRKRDEEDINGVDIITNGEDMEGVEAKRVKFEGESEGNVEIARSQARPTSNPPRRKNVPIGEDRLVVSKAFPEVKGHTSYLTFALLVPSPKVSADFIASSVDALVPVAEDDADSLSSTHV
jgi:hypothetical protein